MLRIKGELHMKRKRILLTGLIAAFSLTLSACDSLPDNLFGNLFNRSSSSEQESSRRIRPSRSDTSVHEHVFSENWEYNTTSHWRSAVCGHDLKTDVGEHTFYENVVKQPTCTTSGQKVQICTVCDYKRTSYIAPIDHNWVEYSRVEPTCEQSGISRRYCSYCGDMTEAYLPSLGHDFMTISYTPSTCSEHGYQRMQCVRCGYLIDEELPTSEHAWGEPWYHEVGLDGSLPYTTAQCMNCNATKIRINAVDGLFNGNIKETVAKDYGFVKMQANGQSVSYTFDYPNNAYGEIYQHGLFDSNPGSAYSSYNYRTGANSTTYNFEVNVNGQVVDLYKSSQYSYAEMLDYGEEISGLSYNGYSLAANCLIGDIYLNQGLNTITYTRLSSYNLWFDALVLVVYDSDHVHTVSPDWSYDENSHWHSCLDPNCPVYDPRIDSDYHTFSEPYIVYDPTCYSEGLQRRMCTVCGYHEDTYIRAYDHDYENIGAFTISDENSATLEEYGCSYCGQYFLRWNALNYNHSESTYIDDSGTYVRFQSGMAENRDCVVQAGAHLIYNIELPVALSDVGLAFLMEQSSTYYVFDAGSNNSYQGYVFDNYGDLVPATKRYALKVNGIEVPLGEDVYGKSNSSRSWYNWPVRLNLVAGLNQIEIICLSGSYRARMFEFQLTGVPYITPNHVHTPGSTLEFDDNCHFYTCVGGDGVRIDEEPHSFGEYIIESNPTCEEYGSCFRECAICGYKQYDSIYPNGHTYEEYYTVVEPTCTEYGLQEATCVVCGQTNQFSISPYGHTFGEPVVIREPTCTECGIEQITCSVCGYVEEYTTSENGHSWDSGVVYQEPTHTESGVRVYTCHTCGEMRTVYISPDHSWSTPEYIVGEDGLVSYTKQQCSEDNAVKLDIKALDGTFENGGYNSSNLPEGYMRLASNGSSISYTFNYDDHAVGRLYLRGMMNNLSNYGGRTYASSSSSSDCFEVLVNGTAVDTSETRYTTYSDLLGGGWEDPKLSSDCSLVNDCLVGYVELVNGINTITYKKLSSPNLNVSDLILVVEHTDHQHSYSSGYDYDDTYHWHTCIDPNCPMGGAKDIKSLHQFDEGVLNDYYSCYDSTYITYTCMDCGYQKVETIYKDHDYDENHVIMGTNSQGYDFTIKSCQTCGRTVTSLPFNSGIINGSISNGKLTSGTTITWALPVYQTGLVSIYLPCKMSSGNTSQYFDPSLYYLSVCGIECNILLPYGIYNDLGIKSSENRYFKFAEYEVTSEDVANGEIEISFTSNVGSYRIIFSGEIRLEY